jgi:His-Xaa-Ser system protein HxsD
MANEITVDFDAQTYSLAVLNAAAYRLANVATCQIEKAQDRYVCRLTAITKDQPALLKTRYLQLVTDENVRASLRIRTEPVRNVILSLAFGALAQNGGE